LGGLDGLRAVSKLKATRRDLSWGSRQPGDDRHGIEASRVSVAGLTPSPVRLSDRIRLLLSESAAE
jgi:hypothetical protein